MRTAAASDTARVIAASTILLDGDARTAALAAPGAAALCRTFLSGSRADRRLAWSVTHPLTRWLWRWVERLTLPGITLHYWQRKRWIERRCREAIGEGFERVLILGAGYDTLGLRLAMELPRLEVIEVDHPATQQAKLRTLTGMPIPPPDNLRFLACNLGAERLPVLKFDDRRATFIIVEGVLMYLSPAHVARLFDMLGNLAADRRRVVFSFMTRWPDGRPGFRPHSWLIERWLAWRSEPFTWSLPPAAMPAFLAAHRLRLLDMVATTQFYDPALPRNTKLEGENLVVCEPL